MFFFLPINGEEDTWTVDAVRVTMLKRNVRTPPHLDAENYLKLQFQVGQPAEKYFLFLIL